MKIEGNAVQKDHFLDAGIKLLPSPTNFNAQNKTNIPKDCNVELLSIVHRVKDTQDEIGLTSHSVWLVKNLCIFA